MLTLNEMILFGCVSLFVVCSAIWLITQLIMLGVEYVDNLKRKYLPSRYYYDYDEED